MSAASRSFEKAIMMKPKSSGRPELPKIESGSPSFVNIPEKVASALDGARMLVSCTCVARSVPPSGFTNQGITILFLGFVVAVCIPLSEKKKQEERIRKREQELMEDYPELVSKYLLLLNAGLSSRSVWERITDDYKKSRRKRYVYEEMLLSMREMENGIPELRCYERFGKRCRLLPYMRFSSALVQNQQKGAKGALHLLEQEAIAAFAERKDAAKRKGEEAGTKLLLPMFGLLGIVLVIVMFPAFWKL